MKKFLLSVLSLSAFTFNAQNYYYPSGNTTNDTWDYQDVVAENYGSYLNGLTGKYGCVIDDAELIYTNYNLNDSYDGAFEFFIDTEDSVYTESGIANNLVDTNGTTISLAEQWINGLYVSKSYYFSPTTPIVRAIFKIRNPNSTPQTVKVGIYTNFGSDSNTELDTCSTGNSNLSNNDRWFITSDLSGSASDPINTSVRFGPGTIASTPVFGIMPEMGSDDFLDTVAVTVPANAYKLIMTFNRMDTTLQAAKFNTATFNDVAGLQAANLLAGLTQAEMDQVVNWDLSSVTTSIIKTTDISNNVNVYPNPATTAVNLGLGNGFLGTTIIRVFDVTGNEVLSKTIEKAAGFSNENFDVSNLANGTYIVKVTNNNRTAVKKFSKQ